MTAALVTLSTGLVQYRRVYVEDWSRVASLQREGWHRARFCSWFPFGRIRASWRENEYPSPMELWPGASLPFDFEFGDEKPKEENLEVNKAQSCVGFNEMEDSVLQPYMGDVDILEEEELPAKYVPPPSIPLEDMEMRDKVEEVMYTLLKCIPGPMTTFLHDQEKWDTLVKIFSETVEFQDPLICLKGIQSFKRLLEVLCNSGIEVSMHEVYYENIAADRFKRWVYVLWTATSINNFEDSLKDSDLTNLRETAYDSHVDHTGEGEDETRNPHTEYEIADKAQDVYKTRSGVELSGHCMLKLSGESKLEVNQEAEVTSVSSRWYKLTEDVDGTELATSKLWLAALYEKSSL